MSADKNQKGPDKTQAASTPNAQKSGKKDHKGGKKSKKNSGGTTITPPPPK